MDALVTPWANARAAHLLSVCRMVPLEVGDGQEEEVDTNGYDQLMYAPECGDNKALLFSYSTSEDREGIHGENALTSWYRPYELRDGSLPQGLTAENMYTKLRKGSKKVVVVVQNNTAYSQTLQKKIPVARAVAALPVPEPPKGEQLLEGADESQDSYTPRLMVRQRHRKLFNELDLSSLDSWTPQLADAACWLLVKYHDVFSLHPTELGCTHSTEHIIKVTDDTPFKE